MNTCCRDNTDLSPSNLVKAIPEMKNNLSGLRTTLGSVFFDNSTLDSMRVCPRRFYFSKIRRWKPDRESLPLVFGSAWHASMDYLWAHPNCTLEQSFEPFQTLWDQSQFAGSEDFDSFPRTPARAKDMLARYIDRYQSWLANNIEVLEVEKPFIVPLSESQQNLFYIGKWDKVYREGGSIYITDHKTSSSFSSTWLDSWSPNGQVDGYLYAGHMTYGDAFKAVMIDGVLVQKSSIDFRKVPIERQIDMLDTWKWEVLDLIEQISYYESELLRTRSEFEETKKREPFLRAFPKCTTSCTAYYGKCPFHDLCRFISNPEVFSENSDDAIPSGFVTDSWKPFQVEESTSGGFTITPHEHDL